MTGYEIRIISDIDEDVPVPFSECADICWHTISSSDIPTVSFNVSVAGRNVIGVGQPLLCGEKEIGKFFLTDLSITYTLLF